jgi:hypothetical protein
MARQVEEGVESYFTFVRRARPGIVGGAIAAAV